MRRFTWFLLLLSLHGLMACNIAYTTYYLSPLIQHGTGVITGDYLQVLQSSQSKFGPGGMVSLCQERYGWTGGYIYYPVTLNTFVRELHCYMDLIPLVPSGFMPLIVLSGSDFTSDSYLSNFTLNTLIQEIENGYFVGNVVSPIGINGVLYKSPNNRSNAFQPSEIVAVSEPVYYTAESRHYWAIQMHAPPSPGRYNITMDEGCTGTVSITFSRCLTDPVCRCQYYNTTQACSVSSSSLSSSTAAMSSTGVSQSYSSTGYYASSTGVDADNTTSTTSTSRIVSGMDNWILFVVIAVVVVVVLYVLYGWCRPVRELLKCVLLSVFFLCTCCGKFLTSGPPRNNSEQQALSDSSDTEDS